MNLEYELSKYENIPIFQMLINIILVANNVRQATLIEHNNYSIQDRFKYQNIIDRWINMFGLKTMIDPLLSYRTFVFKDKPIPIKNDNDIALFLGFYCINHDFSNINTFRSIGSIIESKTHHDIYVEVGETSKLNHAHFSTFLALKTKLFNQCMVNVGLSYRFEYKIDEIIPQEIYIKNYNNHDYVKQNLDEYADIIANEFYSKSIFSSKPETILEKWILFQFIMDQIKIDRFIAFYDKQANKSLEYYEQYEQIMATIEDILLKTDIDYNIYEQILKKYLK